LFDGRRVHADQLIHAAFSRSNTLTPLPTNDRSGSEAVAGVNVAEKDGYRPRADGQSLA